MLSDTCKAPHKGPFNAFQLNQPYLALLVTEPPTLAFNASAMLLIVPYCLSMYFTEVSPDLKIVKYIIGSTSNTQSSSASVNLVMPFSTIEGVCNN